MKMYVISDNADTFMGFRLAGVDGVVAHEKQAVLDALDAAITDRTLGILLMTEKVAALCPERVEALRMGGMPLLVVIPDRHGSGRDRNAISHYIEEAIGLKI